MNVDTMNTIESDVPSMKQSYDFSGGVRGKHAHKMRNGYSITIHHADGTKTVKFVKPAPRSVILDEDVASIFPDSLSVNRALRNLITLMSQMPEVRQPMPQ